MAIELGGFAEYPEDIDGDFEAYNYCLAEDYVNALYCENFDFIGEIDNSFFDAICYWYNYDKHLGNIDTVEQIKNGTFKTYMNRNLFDAIYAKRAGILAEIFINRNYYSPQLLLTVLLSSDDSLTVNFNCSENEEFNSIFKALYDFIEQEYDKQKNKTAFVKKIRNNFGRFYASKDYKKDNPSSDYKWIKQLKRVGK